MNQVLLIKTLNLRQCIISLMPKSRTYQHSYDNDLSLVIDKIRFRKDRARQKINQFKYLKVNRHQETVKSKPNFGTIPMPMPELKKASEMLARQSLLFHEEIKELITGI
jgi:hypothetical protein